MGYIYKITNLVNNKAYVGQTKQPIEIRWEAHVYAAFRENDDNRYYLHRAINKYGLDKFKFEIIEEVPNTKLDEREIYWIAHFHTYRYDEEGNSGYNLTRGGKGNWKFEPETLLQAFFNNDEHLGNTCKDIGCSEPTLIKVLQENRLFGKGSMTAVYQISLTDGSIIRKFDSIVEAADIVQLTPHDLSNALNNYQKTAGGYAWCKVEDYPNFKLEEHIDNKQKKVLCVEKNLQFNMIKDAGKWVYENGYTTSKEVNANICRACKKGIKAYGFHWQYVYK